MCMFTESEDLLVKQTGWAVVVMEFGRCGCAAPVFMSLAGILFLTSLWCF